MQMLHNKCMGSIALRVGLALSLLWSVMTKFTKTDKVAGLLGKLGLNFASNETFVLAMGVFLLVVSILLIVGKYLQAVGIVLTLYFLVTIIAGAVAGDAAFSVGPAIWKDFAFIGASLYFVFTGDGKSCCSK